VADRDHLSFAAVTPARDEAENLRRLAAALAAQTMPPTTWVIVDNGSTDTTRHIAEKLAATHDWIRLMAMPGEPVATRGGPVVRAFERGVEALEEPPDIIVKLDADVSFEPNFFERLLAEFADDQRLGIASGVAYEQRDGASSRRYSTRPHLHGQVHAYRLRCLREISPLEARIGWDTIDAVKAEAHGWRARNFEHLPFRHHRTSGKRDGRPGAWVNRGRAAHYMGYRLSYLLLRTLYRARRDPAALGLIRGYLSAALRREQRCPDPVVIRLIRLEQRLRELPKRIREATGRASGD
jgi:glycosyltransferase involved in cell wall biosynthesis